VRTRSAGQAVGAFSWGEFEILRSVGRGATSVVYEAHDRRRRRRVALKIVHVSPDAAGRRVAARFLCGAGAAASVRHPHAVEVFRYGEAEGAPFLAMERLGGGTLASVVRREGRLPLGCALDVLLPIASAVSAMHAAGVLHGDVKPSNILFEGPATLRAKLSDFGVSRPLAGSQALSEPSDVVGTPAYMAPELVLFAGGAATDRSDQYSLAVTVYECVTGRRPFSGGTAFDTLRAVVAGDVALPSSVEPSLPPALDDAILRAMHPDPERRFGSVDDFARALAALGHPASLQDPRQSELRVRAASRASTMPPPPESQFRSLGVPTRTE